MRTTAQKHDCIKGAGKMEANYARDVDVILSHFHKGSTIQVVPTLGLPIS